MKHRIVALAVVAGALVTGVASAQTQSVPPVDPQGPGGTARGARAGQRNPGAAQAPALNVNQAENQVQMQWNTAVLRASRSALQLSDQQFPVFFMKMQDLQAVRDRHQAQRRRLIGELGKLTLPMNGEPPADDATLLARTNALDLLESQLAQQEQVALAAVDAVLTPFQRARFRVFEENMEKQKLKMLAQVLSPGTPKLK